VSFSRSLCEHIVRSENNRTLCYLASAKLVLGKKLGPGETSASGVYAVVKAKTKWPLRVTLFKELAELWRHETRDVYECRLPAETWKIIPRVGW
jgi:hypothetical protein